MSRFPGIIWAGDQPRGLDGMTYQVYMTGSAPKRMRFKLETMDPEMGITVFIKYESAQSRALTIDDVEVPYNKWISYSREQLQNDPELKDGYGPILQEKCGENRYIGVENIFEFYIDGTCDIGIQPRDAIQTQVRMEWTMEAFFADGGTTTFVDRLCGSLGIHASTVKVIGAKEGSVIVDYEILPSADEPMNIDQIRARQT